MLLLLRFVTLVSVLLQARNHLFLIVSKYLIFQEIEKYKLGDPRSFHYLNQSNCYELVGISDAKDYLATRRAMDIVGISSHEQVLAIGYYICVLSWRFF